MKKLRILVVLDSLGCGGTERYFLSLFDKIDRDRFEFYVSYSKEGRLTREFSKRNISLFKTPIMNLKNFFSNIQTTRLFQDFIKRNRIDILQTNFFASGLWSSRAARRVGIPCIRTIWASIIDQGFSERFLSRKIFKKFYNNLADIFLCLFNSSREELIAKCFVREEKISLINLGIDTDKFRPGEKDSSLIDEFGIEDGSPVVGMVSGLHDVKRPDLFLNSIPLIKKKVKEIKEHLLQNGISRQQLDRVHAPVGLAIGAETPEEIAIAILAEIIKVRKGC